MHRVARSRIFACRGSNEPLRRSHLDNLPARERVAPAREPLACSLLSRRGYFARSSDYAAATSRREKPIRYHTGAQTIQRSARTRWGSLPLESGVGFVALRVIDALLTSLATFAAATSDIRNLLCAPYIALPSGEIDSTQRSSGTASSRAIFPAEKPRLCLGANRRRRGREREVDRGPDGARCVIHPRKHMGPIVYPSGARTPWRGGFTAAVEIRAKIRPPL